MFCYVFHYYSFTNIPTKQCRRSYWRWQEPLVTTSSRLVPVFVIAFTNLLGLQSCLHHTISCPDERAEALNLFSASIGKDIAGDWCLPWGRHGSHSRARSCTNHLPAAKRKPCLIPSDSEVRGKRENPKLKENDKTQPQSIITIILCQAQRQ